VVKHFIAQAAQGIDVFRIFDCLNWVENMRVAIDAVIASGKVAEGALCYTGDILDPNRAKYSLAYYCRSRPPARGGGAAMCSRSRTWPACSSCRRDPR